MPYRFTPLVDGEHYHIYNRGVARQPIFSSKKDYERFLLCLSYYRLNNLPCKLSRLLQIPKEERDPILQSLQKANDQIIEVVAFCLMPNHFHFLIKQIKENGISTLIRHIINSYTRYINKKNERVGPLFQGPFKAVHITSDEQLLHLSRYIHLNPLISLVIRDENFIAYPWSSLQNYLYNRQQYTFINPKIILENFKSPTDYLKFIMDNADYAKELKQIKHLTFE